jgi:soluble lytic murein transglycosylase-like protein
VAGWEEVCELDLRFARSLRHSRARRELAPPLSRLARVGIRSAVLAVVLLVGLAETANVATSHARTPSRAVGVRPLTHTSCALPRRFRAAFDAASARTRIPVSLLSATAYEESRFDPGAESFAGARGLLQLLPSTARGLRAETRDPAANVLAGARYLQQMLDRFGSLELGLAAYNAGPTAVARAGGAPSLETLRYLKNVEARANRLVGCG